jgi:hypothetical protein
MEGICIMRIERPVEYVKVVASLMPNDDCNPLRFTRIERVIVQVEHSLG